MTDQTTFDLVQYLRSTGIQYEILQKLKGGTANFVWRIIDESGHSRIIKHAEAYIASNPGIPFPLDRMDFEYRALKTIPIHIPANDLIQLPGVFSYDAEQHVLTIADGGGRTLKDAYTDPSIDVSEYGHRIGAWLASLHQSTKDTAMSDNVTAKHIYRHSYRNAPAAAKRFGLNPVLAESVNLKYGNMLSTDDECVCHGDFWPGNILVGDQGLTVVDWEMVRRGCGATDVGQFAAEAYLLDRFHGNKGLLSAFLSGYKQARDLEDDFVKRVQVHMGVHLAFWPTVVQWASHEETKNVLVMGHKMMRDATRDDWKSLLKMGAVGELCR